ncbi:MAG TPA: hypothetical protein VKS01_08340, partial [Bryobacteraceae bacterium]|nr:hypothetical protein [Bryobacteraceae bacterium]
IAIILAVSGTAAAGIALIHVNWNSPLHVPLLADQYLALSMMMTLLASRAFFRQFPQFPIRPNALRHLTVLTAVFATNFIGLSIGLISAGQWRWATSFAINVGANLAYIGWAFFMTPEGEQLSFDPPPPMSPEDFDHAEMRHKRSVERIKQAGSRGWRRLLGC